MTRKDFQKIGMAIYAVFCATIVAFFSFVSIQTAVIFFVLSSTTFVVVSERLRRTNWETSVDFRFQHLQKKHDALVEEVAKHKETIETLQAQKAHHIREEAVSYRTIEKQPQKPNASKKVAAAPANVTVIEDAESLSDLVVEELTGHAVRSKKIDVFIQPIVRLPQRQRRFYEVFSRVHAKPGVYIPASRYLDIANKNDQIQEIDTLLLAKCLDMVKECCEMEDAPSFFININARTLKNTKFMSHLLNFLSNNKELAERLVFEMPQKEFGSLPASALRVMSGLARLGCSFSLDQVTELEENIQKLQEFRVRYLKADISLFPNSAHQERDYKTLMRAKRVLEGNGIGLIVQGIENEDMMRSILDYDLHYGQGYLFGRPDVRGAYEPEMLEERA